MRKGLHIRQTSYGPSIYDGRAKVEGPFPDEWTAAHRLDTLKGRKANPSEPKPFVFKLRSSI